MIDKKDCSDILIKIAVLEERVDNLERGLNEFGARIESDIEKMSEQVESRFKWILALLGLLISSMIGASAMFAFSI